MNGSLLATMALVSALIFAPGAIADHDSGCVPGAADPATYVRAGPYYVENRGPNPYGVPVLWVYQETNGLPGLQRGDFDAVDEHCGHGADTFWL